MTGLEKPPSVLKAFALDEAKKKDNYPNGTLRLYTGKMANKDFHAHIYVKTGKAGKPWSYYATYPSAKASEILNAGAGLVVITDGKYKVHPATPGNLDKFGQEHPFKGELIPSLVDGDYSLGSVDDNGNVSIDPDGLKELTTTVDKLKAADAGTEAPTPPPPPPEAALPPPFDPEAKALSWTADDLSSSASTVKDHLAAAEAHAQASMAYNKIGALSLGTFHQNKAYQHQAIAKDLTNAAAMPECGTCGVVGGGHLGTCPENEKNQAPPPPAPSKVIPFDATMKDATVQQALKDYAADLHYADSLADAYPGLKGYFEKLLPDGGDYHPENWKKALFIAQAFYKDPELATLHYIHGGKAGLDAQVIAKNIAKELGIEFPEENPNAVPPDASFAHPVVQAALGVYNSDQYNSVQLGQLYPGLAAALQTYIDPAHKSHNWKDTLFVANALKDDPEAAFKNYLGGPGSEFGYLAKLIAKDLGIPLPKSAPAKKLVPDDATFAHPAVLAAIKQYGDDSISATQLVAQYPGLQDFLQKQVQGMHDWKDALFVAFALSGGDPQTAFDSYSTPGKAQYQYLVNKIAAQMGIELPKKKKDSEAGLPMSFTNPKVLATLDTVGKGETQPYNLGLAYPDMPAFFAGFLDGEGDWEDALHVAVALKKDPETAFSNYGPFNPFHSTCLKIADAMGIEPPKKKKKKDAEAALGVNPDPTPAPPPTAPATPGNAPTPEEQKLKGMVSYLKQIGFGNKTKQADFTKSTAWMGQMASEYGKNWLSKLVLGATALGIDPETLEAPGEVATLEPAMTLPPSGLPLHSTLKNIGMEHAANGELFSKLGKKSKEFIKAYATYTGLDHEETAGTLAQLALDPQKISDMNLTGKYLAGAKKIAKDMGIVLPEPKSGGVTAPPIGAFTPQAPSTGTSAKEAPAPVNPLPPAQFASLATPQVPPLSSMKKGASAKSLGGAGKKDFYSLGKQKYLVKLALEKDGTAKPKPFAAIVQEVYSSVALTVRPDHIPLRVDTNETGVMVTVQPFLDRGEPPTVEGMAPSKLTPQERADVASEHVLDWMMSQHDSYGGNLVRRNDGRIVGVDKEQAFRFFPDDKLDVDYNPNPIEPYYNQFWKAFRDGQMEFDPKVMKSTIDKVEQISDMDYQAQIERYAKSIWPSEVNKRAKFLQQALERKKNLRADFEGFISHLYQKKTGQTKGVFTFNAGWDPTGKAPTAAKKKNLVKVKAKEWSIQMGLKEYPYAPTEGPEKGKTDSNKLVLKIPKGDENLAKLNQFFKDTGLQPQGSIVSGAYYHLAIIDKKAYDAVEIEKELAKPIEVEPEDSSALVEIDPHKHAEMNNQEIAEIETAQLGPLGKRFASDSAGIEGQYMRAKRLIDANGELSYMFQFKMRPAMVATLQGGVAGEHGFPKLTYQPGPDALHDTGEKATHMTLKGLKWKTGNSEAFIYKDDHQYTFKNSVFVKVKPKKGQTVQAAFDEALEKMRPGLAKDLMRNPTADEREVAKLARLLWAAAPQEADNLKNTDYTLPKLKEKLAKHGFDDNDFSKIEERETYSGLQSHVIPGRHKKLGGGKFRFMFNGVSDVSAAVSVLKLGLLGISERAMMGIHLKGGSVESDIHEGAGDQVLLRAVTENGFSTAMNGHAFGGAYQAIVDPAEADRLDSYMHLGDQFGSCSPHGSHSHAWTNRKTIEKCIDSQASSYKPSAEIMFRKGIAKTKILRMAAPSESARATLIKAAKAAGIVEMNGVSIDNFVVVAGTSGEAYEKCVKPVLAKAAAKAASK